MSLSIKALAFACAGICLSATAGFAQVGGSDIPRAAKAKGQASMHSSSRHRASHHMMMRTKSMKHGTMMRSRGKMPGHKTF